MTYRQRSAALLQRSKDWLKAQYGAPMSHYTVAACVVSLCILMSAALEYLLDLPAPNLLLVFLTGVLIVATRTALFPALATAIISFLAYNFFFTEPRFSFSIRDSGEISSVFFFLVIAIIGGSLANRLRVQIAALRATNDQAQMLLSLNKKLAETPDPAAMQHAAVKTIAAFQGVSTCLLRMERDASLEIIAAAPGPVVFNDEELAAATWCFEHRRASGYRSEIGTSIAWRFLPLNLNDARYGVLGIKLSDTPNRVPPEQLLLLEALANQLTLILARNTLVLSLEQAHIAEETERLRSALLSSVSHDLRTPLSSMIGAASSLRDLDAQLSRQDKHELLDAVLTEGHRLNRYIENLLDMTRLGHGTLKLQRDWVALADVVAAALRRTKKLFTNVKIVRDIPHDLPLLHVHPALMEQLLVNVIENAAHFSPPEGNVRVAACAEQGRLVITITDEGPGVPEEQRERVFDMFFRGGGGDQEPYGSGLGLTICAAIVGAHGGTIGALEGPGSKGTTIEICLPLGELPRTEPSDERSVH